MHINKNRFELIRQYKAKTKRQNGLISASVAIIIRESRTEPEFLLMQRAKHKNDPWSGQMAFPGGKFEARDKSHKRTAIRETAEEVGLSLSDNDYLGRIDDVYGFKANGEFSVHVTCFVFKINRDVLLTANNEVADMIWLPFSYLENPQNSYNFFHPHDLSLKMPAILINKDKEQILWGLSLRLLYTLFTILNKPMNALNAEEKRSFKQVEQLEVLPET